MDAAPTRSPETRLKLKDGRDLLVRPVGLGDLDAVCEFFAGLPEADKAYLRFDVNDREVVARRLEEIQSWGRLKRLVAMDGERVVATGVLELKDTEKEFDLAEMRLIVGHDYQRRGLGMLLARELYFLAAREKICEVRAKVMRPQEAALAILRRLGFHEVEVIEDGAVDRYGKRQDLIVMCCALQELWHEMELQVEKFDLQSR